jgi:hypothetical protein
MDVLDMIPHHEHESQESEAAYTSAKPEYLAICLKMIRVRSEERSQVTYNQNDRKILENRVDGNAEELLWMRLVM